MKLSWLLLLTVCWSSVSVAAEWTFSKPELVTADIERPVFHHLEPAGRRSIAYSGNTVAVTWEDDRDGSPRAYLARRSSSDSGFSSELKISGKGEAYDPVIVGLEGSRFMLAWEEESQVFLSISGPDSAGPAIRLSSAGSQPSISRYGKDAVVVWSERSGKHGQVKMARIIAGEADTPVVKEHCRVDSEEAKDEQLYPAVTEVGREIVVAWEDRRPGHTIIMAVQGEPCRFSLPVRISAAIEQRSVTYGKGHGVSRVSLTTYGTGKVLAAWADKRDFREGYDIYAAAFQAGSNFGENMRVQDDFGGIARQWHPTAAGHNNGSLAVVWTDEREGNSDLVISSYEEGEWGEDIPLPGASGPGEQGHPSIIFDAAGQLHIVWIERDERNSATRLKYMSGHMIKE